MPMEFCFYPKHEYACPQVSHCPHLGGAALGTLVDAASEHDQYLRMLWGQLDFERGRNTQLFEENIRLQAQVEQLKLELKVERQSKFASSASLDQTESEPAANPVSLPVSDGQPKKRGAPVGHPGWFRPQPEQYDRLIEVAPPCGCPHCTGTVHLFPNVAPSDHWQEDVVDGRHQVVLYRHLAGRCKDCRRWVRQAGEGEILGSRIGPRLRAWAVYLRNGIGISYRKVPAALEELLGVRFSPAALLGFERVLAELAQPLAEDIAKKIASSDGAVHADETYWTLDAHRAYYWVHCTEAYVHFQFDMSRAGEVSRKLLGPYFDGSLVTDCYAGYEAHPAKAKQKSLKLRIWQPSSARGGVQATSRCSVGRAARRICLSFRNPDFVFEYSANRSSSFSSVS
jgi:hypothetical protein